jgi:hypothetical protein
MRNIFLFRAVLVFAVLRWVEILNQRDYKVYADMRQTLQHSEGRKSRQKTTDIPLRCRQYFEADRIAKVCPR